MKIKWALAAIYFILVAIYFGHSNGVWDETMSVFTYLLSAIFFMVFFIKCDNEE